jgi:hypothetical protein
MQGVPRTPMEALAAASSSSSSSPPIFHASLANFVSMETVFVRKPFRNRAEQEEVIQDAIETGQDMLKIPASAPPTVKYHISYGFILLELTGTPAWIKAALALAKSRYWKKEKSIRISKTVKIKPYLKKGDYDEEEPNLNRGSPKVYLHGPDSLRPSWMNLPSVEPVKGKVSEHARMNYGAEHPDDALTFAARNSSTRRDRIYHEEAAFNKGMEYQREAAAIYAEAYKAGLIKGAAAARRSNAAGGSGMGGGNRRKTRKHRK